MTEEHEIAEVYQDEWWPVLTCGVCDRRVSGDPDDVSEDLTTARPIVHMRSIREDDFATLTTQLEVAREALERIVTALEIADQRVPHTPQHDDAMDDVWDLLPAAREVLFADTANTPSPSPKGDEG